MGGRRFEINFKLNGTAAFGCDLNWSTPIAVICNLESGRSTLKSPVATPVAKRRALQSVLHLLVSSLFSLIVQERQNNSYTTQAMRQKLAAVWPKQKWCAAIL